MPTSIYLTVSFFLVGRPAVDNGAHLNLQKFTGRLSVASRNQGGISDAFVVIGSLWLQQGEPA